MTNKTKPILQKNIYYMYIYICIYIYIYIYIYVYIKLAAFSAGKWDC